MRIGPLVTCLVVAATAAAQEAHRSPVATVAESLGAPWGQLASDFTALAEAMPADRYDFVPTQGEFAGVRSFGEQVKHVACATYGFFNQIEGRTPPPECWNGGPSPARTKAELVAYLRESFDYGHRITATLDERSLLDIVAGPYGGSRTKLGMAVLGIWHASDHYGQLVEYLRMNGIVPPASRPAPANR